MRFLPMLQTPQTCHWSVPTLLMPKPYWLAADDDPWSCWNDRQILVLTSTEICHTCPVWKPRQNPHTVGPIPAEGAMPFRAPESALDDTPGAASA